MNRRKSNAVTFYTHLGLRSKMLIIFILILVIPLSLQGILTYYEFSASVERRSADYSTQIVGQINRNLDRTLLEMQRLSLMPLYDTQVLAIVKKYSQPQFALTRPTLAEMEKMFLYISGSAYNRSEVKGIQIIANNGFIFTNVDSSMMNFYADVRQEDWFRKVQVADGAWVVIPQHQPNYYNESSSQVFSVARMIREPDKNDVIGMIKIDLKLDVFRQILSNVKFEEKGSMLVVNERNELLFEESSSNLEPRFAKTLRDTKQPNENAVRDLVLNGQRFLTIVDYSDYSGLKVIDFIPVDSLLSETKKLRNFTIVIAVIFVVAAIILSFIFSYHLSSPLIRLKQKMQLLERGQFNQSVPVMSQDEIGQLSRGFNRMAEEINHLIKEVYLIGLREKEAELAALQSQINPHFIYNTLESINMKALERENYEVSDMVSTLGQLMRYTVDQYDRLVLLKEELASVGSYAKIQQLRYGDRLRIIFDIEPGLERSLVPKLLLQPLVENSIFHGVGDKPEGGTIWISAVRFSDDLLLTVRDDGIGMTESEVERLRLSLTSPLPDGERKQGVALRNINQRLVLMFGSSYELQFDGSPDQGMAFTITIPITERMSGDVQNSAG
ncbi:MULTISPECIES: cache domain-containing sensor histidine kinase [unclassified Paenibacillus]|uniref:cache domain-containing sensor histidine kinase n=1 Tax=unclassified Paenibacillus TaxID=185978 RepID=UPI0036288378